jgi:(R,R)-butanediol dehydrogenase / meso-butanediol dehydrogenase / diacetyl reductase
MRQVRVHGPNDVRIDDVEPPVPGPSDAVVRVAACGICGTDRSYITHGGVAGPGPEPLALGHEMAGVVDWVGADVDGIAAGDRVVVHPGDDELGRIGNGAPEGGLTSSLLVREARRGTRLLPVPDQLTLDVAALTEPLDVGMHAVEQSDARPGESVAVFGCGPIGLAAIASLRDRGVERVVGIDLSEQRRALAVALGAEAALDPAVDDVWRELARRHGTARSMFGVSPATDVYLEASGAPRVVADFVDRSRRDARLTVVALHYEAVPTNLMLVMAKQLTIRGSIEYPVRFEAGLELLRRRDLSAMITHRVPLDRFGDALETLADNRDCGKVMVMIGDDA